MNGLISKEKDCIICGKKFNIIVDLSTNKILTDCFHGYLPKHLFLGWTYEIINLKTFKTKIRFKNKTYRIIGFCKWSREIYHYVWKLFHKGKTEYWECTVCNNKPNNE